MSTYTIISREPAGQNVRVNFEHNGKPSNIVFDYYRSGRYQVTANHMFYSLKDINDDEKIIDALRYVCAR